jgi:EpsI family protein
LGQIGSRRIIIVIVLFVVASIVVYIKPAPKRSSKVTSMDQVLQTVDGWKAGAHVPYDAQVIRTLALDDYLNRTFSKDGKAVSLYIGYYKSAAKLGAVHDPLVCFPGQGWEVSDQGHGEMAIEEGSGQKVSYSTMLVKRGTASSQLILYWFQAYETASADTLSQKLAALQQKFSGVGEDNAFVRLSCPVVANNEVNCLETMQDFTRAFYPVFLDYIRR